MRVLVTGGAGFIGSNLVHAIAARGDEVIVYDDFSGGRRENLEGLPPSPRHEIVWGDVRDTSKLTRVMQAARTEVVFHLAALGSVPRSLIDPEGSLEVNVSGTLAVLRASVAAGAQRVVYASSSSVYGPRAGLPAREDAPIDPASPYAMSKAAAEGLVRVWGDLGVETVCLRYFNVYGPRQRPGVQYPAVVPIFVARMLAGDRPVIFGHPERDFTFVDDVVRATVLAAERGRSRDVFNVAGGEPHSLVELVAEINTALGTRLEPQFAAPRAGDVPRSCGDGSRAGEVLGWWPEVGFHEGVRRTVDWLSH